MAVAAARLEIEMQPTTRTWLIIGICVLLSLLVVTAALAYRMVVQLEGDSHWARHTRDVLEALDQVDSTVKDAESGQRGYLLTGNDSYLEPYNTARAQQSDDLDRIANLIQDDANQARRIPRLKELVSAKFADLEKTVAARREENMDAALKRVQTDEGRRMSQQIQAVIDRMQEDELELLFDRQWSNRNTYRSAIFAVGAIEVLAVLALALFVWLLVKRVPASHDLPGASRGLPRSPS